MNSFPNRCLLFGLVPIVMGGVIGWVARPAARDDEVIRAAAADGRPQKPVVGGGPAEGRRGSLSVSDSALAAQAEFCERLRGAGVERMAEFLDEAAQAPDSIRQRALQELIIEHMVPLDPLAVWMVLEEMKLNHLRPQFFGVWARTDAEAALTWVEGRGEETKELMENLVAGLLPDDVEALASIWPRVPPGMVPEGPIAGFFRRLASVDPLQARQLLEGMEAGTSRNMGATAFAEGWARGDAEAAYAWAKELSDPAERESALRGVFRAWAESDPQGVAGRLDELAADEPRDKNGHPMARGDSPVRAIVRAWAAHDPQAAAAWLQDRPEDGTDSFRRLFAAEILPLRDNWSVVEVAEMIRRPGEKLVTDTKDRLYNSSSGMGYGDRWISIVGPFGGSGSPLGDQHFFSGPPPVRFDDPGAAFEELSRQPPDATRQHLLQEVANQWAERDPEAARAKLRETDDEFLKLGLMNALSNVARNSLDLELAAAVRAAHPNESGPWSFGTGEIYEQLVKQDPERARALLAGELDDSERSILVREVAKDQATYDPAGAVAWAMQQSNESLREVAMGSAVRQWAEADAYAASEWLATQPEGGPREAAVKALVETLADPSPEEALAWAGALSDPTQRDQQMGTVIRSLARRDPERARQLVESAAVENERRQELIDLIERSRR